MNLIPGVLLNTIDSWLTVFLFINFVDTFSNKAKLNLFRSCNSNFWTRIHWYLTSQFSFIKILMLNIFVSLVLFSISSRHSSIFSIVNFYIFESLTSSPFSAIFNNTLIVELCNEIDFPCNTFRSEICDKKTVSKNCSKKLFETCTGFYNLKDLSESEAKKFIKIWYDMRWLTSAMTTLQFHIDYVLSCSASIYGKENKNSALLLRHPLLSRQFNSIWKAARHLKKPLRD